MSYKVITHNGKAHMDELLGIALLSVYKKCLPEEITRVHPERAAEMVHNKELDVDLYYIDCGLKFDIEYNLFDHHHSGEIGCSALLLFEHLFPTHLHTKFYEYIKLVSLVDTKGPNSLDDFKFNSQSINYFGFTQKLILKQFEEKPLIIAELFKDGIESIMDFEKKKEDALKWLESGEHISVIKVGTLNVLKYNNKPPTEISSALKSLDGDKKLAC